MPTVFEVSGRMAMFRKPYTTTSSVSYPFPPPTALAGMIAAILGYDNGASEKGWNAFFWEEMKGTQVALRIMNSVSWRSETINLWKAQKNPHIQVKHQFIEKPKYRVFVKGALEKVLDDYLKNKNFIYTPYLGVAYALCEISYLGNFSEEEISDYPLKIDSVVPFVDISGSNDDLEIDVLASGGIFRERVPFSMDGERALEKSVIVLYQLSSDKKIVIKKKGDIDVKRCGEDVVAWFSAW